MVIRSASSKINHTQIIVAINLLSVLFASTFPASTIAQNLSRQDLLDIASKYAELVCKYGRQELENMNEESVRGMWKSESRFSLKDATSSEYTNSPVYIYTTMSLINESCPDQLGNGARDMLKKFNVFKAECLKSSDYIGCMEYNIENPLK